MNRRTFIQTVIAASAAPTVIPARVLGQDAPSKRINVGMIGCGRHGTSPNLDQFLKMADVSVIAVCDVDPWRMDNAQKKTNDHYKTNACKAYRDFRELLQDKDIDAVMVSTCDHWHIPHALAAVRAGKDVSVEKPIALSIREGRLLADEAKRLGRVTRNDSECRGVHQMALAAEAVLNGRIGKLTKVYVTVPAGDVTAPPVTTPDPVPDGFDYDMWLGPCPEAPYIQRRVHDPQKFNRPHWMRVLGHCEGMVTNWGTHVNDVAHMAMRMDESGPVWVKAKTWKQPPRENVWNVLTDFDIDYRYANGVELNYKVDPANHAYTRFEGEDGWVQASFSGQPKDTPNITASAPDVLKDLDKAPVRLPRTIDKRDFIDCVKSRARTMQDAEVGRRTCAMCQLGHISIQLGGREVVWDPAKEVSPDPDVNKLTDRPHWRGHWLDPTPRA
ncbi:MAG: Gfo/Idh/MocA family oxidoreductase [Kiritimatiellaeota bacterium]|nr:Gfo/Idh/MocA family oxidoreductase [Kiritimatiellota bacterium]